MTGRSAGSQRLGDTAREAIAALASRPGRTVLLALGAALGTAVLVASLLLAASASSQVQAQFDQLRSTRITVTNPTDATWLDPDNLDRAGALPGVTGAGSMRQAAEPIPVASLGGPWATPVPSMVVAATPAALQAAGAHLVDGRLYDGGASGRGDPVVVLGAALARSLGMPDFDGKAVISVGGARMLVVGIIDAGPKGDPNLLLGAYVPAAASLAVAPVRWQPPTVVIDTDLDATKGIAAAAPVALSPTGTEGLIVQTPADPQGLRSAVSDQLRLFLLGLGAISLVIGTVVIATATVSAIGQRRTEIALRRALGTSRSAIYLQVLIETSLTGLAGGTVGVYLGELTVALVAAGNGWPIVTNLTLIPIGAAIGLLAGVLAGIYPALSAATAQPATALRT